MTIKTISLFIMAAFYIYAGVNHFRHPKFYLRIMPPYLPYKKALNDISGIVEIILGVLLLVPSVSTWAAWGIIALLIAVTPVNLYHLTSKGAGMKVPMWALWLRMFVQVLFFMWAYWHTY